MIIPSVRGINVDYLLSRPRAMNSHISSVKHLLHEETEPFTIRKGTTFKLRIFIGIALRWGLQGIKLGSGLDLGELSMKATHLHATGVGRARSWRSDLKLNQKR